MIFAVALRRAGVAECCDAFCRACGRGHVHVLPHDARAVATVAGRRRARVVWTNGDPGDAALPRDELTHDCYWATVGWAAPGTAAQLAEYRKCGAACGSEEHQNDAAQSAAWRRGRRARARVRACLLLACRGREQ